MNQKKSPQVSTIFSVLKKSFNSQITKEKFLKFSAFPVSCIVGNDKRHSNVSVLSRQRARITTVLREKSNKK